MMFYTYIWCIYGSPETVTSDRGPQFISAFMDELCNLTGVQQKLSSGGHPQTNGNIEVYNQYLQLRLHPFLNHFQDNWSELLPAIDFTQTVTSHSSTDLTPAMMEMGTQPHISYNWLKRVCNIRTFKNTVKKQVDQQETRIFAQRIREYVSWAKVNLAIT